MKAMDEWTLRYGRLLEMVNMGQFQVMKDTVERPALF